LRERLALVHNYEILQKEIQRNERHSVAFWTNLIKKTLDEIDQELLQRTGLPQEERLVTYTEYRAWAESLGKIKGWSHEME
jgi:hypothetical protein